MEDSTYQYDNPLERIRPMNDRHETISQSDPRIRLDHIHHLAKLGLNAMVGTIVVVIVTIWLPSAHVESFLVWS